MSGKALDDVLTLGIGTLRIRPGHFRRLLYGIPCYRRGLLLQRIIVHLDEFPRSLSESDKRFVNSSLVFLGQTIFDRSFIKRGKNYFIRALPSLVDCDYFQQLMIPNKEVSELPKILNFPVASHLKSILVME